MGIVSKVKRKHKDLRIATEFAFRGDHLFDKIKTKGKSINKRPRCEAQCDYFNRIARNMRSRSTSDTSHNVGTCIRGETKVTVTAGCTICPHKESL